MTAEENDDATTDSPKPIAFSYTKTAMIFISASIASSLLLLWLYNTMGPILNEWRAFRFVLARMLLGPFNCIIGLRNCQVEFNWDWGFLIVLAIHAIPLILGILLFRHPIIQFILLAIFSFTWQLWSVVIML